MEERIWGAINIEELQTDAFDHDDVTLLSTLANQVISAIRVAALAHRLRAAELELARARSPA